MACSTSVYCLQKGKWSSKAHACWMVNLSRTRWLMGGNPQSPPHLVIMNLLECTQSHATVILVQASLFKWLHSCLPRRNGSNEPVRKLSTEQVGEENRTCQTGRDQHGNKRNIGVPPQGLVLATIFSSPLHWFDSRCSVVFNEFSQIRLRVQQFFQVFLLAGCVWGCVF